jgi:hypothetical protein
MQLITTTDPAINNNPYKNGKKRPVFGALLLPNAIQFPIHATG